MKLFRTARGPLVEFDGRRMLLKGLSWDDLLSGDDLAGTLRRVAPGGETVRGDFTALAPIGSQEVWAAGVTYWRSRDARMDEARKAGGDTFYDRVYAADRPELFFK